MVSCNCISVFLVTYPKCFAVNGGKRVYIQHIPRAGSFLSVFRRIAFMGIELNAGKKQLFFVFENRKKSRKLALWADHRLTVFINTKGRDACNFNGFTYYKEDTGTKTHQGGDGTKKHRG